MNSPEIVQAYIPHGRIAEMMARGWNYAGPGEEGTVLMEGPELSGAPQSLGAAVGRVLENMANAMAVA